MEDRRRNTYIGIGIILVIALVIAAAPSGGDFQELVSSSIQAAFLAAIGVSVARLYRSQSMWLHALSDRDRGILYGAGSIAVLAIVGDERFKSIGSGGSLIKWGIIGACLFAAYWVWRESRKYSF